MDKRGTPILKIGVIGLAHYFKEADGRRFLITLRNAWKQINNSCYLRVSNKVTFVVDLLLFSSGEDIISPVLFCKEVGQLN